MKWCSSCWLLRCRAAARPGSHSAPGVCRLQAEPSGAGTEPPLFAVLFDLLVWESSLDHLNGYGRWWVRFIFLLLLVLYTCFESDDRLLCEEYISPLRMKDVCVYTVMYACMHVCAYLSFGIFFYLICLYGIWQYKVTIYLSVQASPQSLVLDVRKRYWKKHGIYTKAVNREYGLWKNDRFWQEGLVN